MAISTGATIKQAPDFVFRESTRDSRNVQLDVSDNTTPLTTDHLLMLHRQYRALDITVANVLVSPAQYDTIRRDPRAVVGIDTGNVTVYGIPITRKV